MAAPSFPLINGQTSTPGTPVTLALTLQADPDNPVVGDLHILNGQIHFWDGDNGRRQKIWVVLQFFFGEWWINPDEGIPYIQSIIGQKGISRTVVLTIFRQALLQIPGVARIDSLNFTLNNATRAASVVFAVVFDDGAIIRSTDFGPLLIKVP